MKKDLKVAIVCDWLTGVGGAERVVLELHKLFPNAPIYTSQYDKQAIDWFDDADVRTLWLQRLPKSLKKFLPPLRAIAFRQLNLSSYDLVISSSGAEAKAVKTGNNTVHICYCHAPTHYYWMRYDEYLKNPGFGKLDWVARLGLKILVGPLRRLDYRAAQRPSYLIANSRFTKNQIKKYYDRESDVIFPPVDIDKFKNSISESTKEGLLAIGRQTPYKKIDLAIAAANKLGQPITVIGNGPDHRKLTKMAGSNVSFITNASDKDIAKYMASAKTFIFPGVDDFGIVAVEALASGTPVIAYDEGGASDYIIDGINGLLFNKQTIKSLATALEKISTKKFSSLAIQNTSKPFSIGKFSDSILTFITKSMS
jgi:glycosyltransferase involved in cell wall biosynthesis